MSDAAVLVCRRFLEMRAACAVLSPQYYCCAMLCVQLCAVSHAVNPSKR